MKLIKKLFSFSIGSLLAAMIGIISIPILTRIIEPAEYGVATIFLTIGSLLGIITVFGLDQAFVRFFYTSRKKNLLKKTFFISIMILGFLNLLLNLFEGEISNYVSPQGNYAFLFSLYVFSYVLFRFSNLILRMLQFGYRYSLILALQKFLEFVFIINFAFFVSPSHYSILFGSITTMLVLSIISLGLSKSFWLIDDKELEKKQSVDLVRYSLPLMLSTLMALLFQSFDKFFLNYWGSSEELGIYSAGFKLIAVLNILQTSFATFWAPVSLEQYKNEPNNRKFFSDISKIMTIVMITVAILVILLKDILVLFLGAEYKNASSVIPALVLMPIMYTMSETTVQGINFSLKTHIHILVTGIALFINVILSIILIPKFGMEGAALSVGLAYTSFYFSRTYFGLKYFNFDIKFKQTFTIISLLIMWIIFDLWINSDYLQWLGAAFLLFLLQKLFKEEIVTAINFVNKNIKSIKEI
ncbi:lipopolysaccharide biosynthesis protein [Planococcus sp. FY231025]|uniref:lipopolysaccharide biosynthesis protein n=1 Tax=Planococcus sp. FY231025 TaxID=3455699 RepID=UPI003F902F78